MIDTLTPIQKAICDLIFSLPEASGKSYLIAVLFRIDSDARKIYAEMFSKKKDVCLWCTAEISENQKSMEKCPYCGAELIIGTL